MSLFKTARHSLHQSGRSASAAAVKALGSSTQFPTFNSPADVLNYSNSHISKLSTVDVISLLGHADSVLAPASQSSQDFSEIREHPGFQRLVQAGSNAITTAPRGQLSSLLLNLSKLATFNRHPQIRTASKAIADRILEKQMLVDPKGAGSLLEGLSRLEVLDIRLVGFLEEELVKLVPAMPPAECRHLLMAMHRLKFRNAQIEGLIREKFVSGIDQLKNADVEETLRLMTITGFWCTELLHRCSRLLQEHTELFEVTEIVGSIESLIKLGSLSTEAGRHLTDQLQGGSRKVSGALQSRVLRILERVIPGNPRFADRLIQYHLTTTRETTFGERCIAAHAICYFGLTERKPALKSIMDSLLASKVYPTNYLRMLMETVEACSDVMGMKISIPGRLAASWEEYLALAATPPAYLTEILESAAATRRFSFERNQKVGPFHLTYVDHKAKFAVEVVDVLPIHGQRLFKHAIQKHGYEVCQIPLLRLRNTPVARRPEIVQKALTRVLEMGRTRSGEAAARRETASSGQTAKKATTPVKKPNAPTPVRTPKAPMPAKKASPASSKARTGTPPPKPSARGGRR